MAEATHLLGLPLKHKMRDIKDLAEELTKYLLIDGSRAMTGSLDLDAIINWVKWAGIDLAIAPLSPTELCVRRITAPFELRDLRVRNFKMGGNLELRHNAYFYTQALYYGAQFHFKAFDDILYDWVTVASVKADSGWSQDENFEIPRAGNITLVSNKLLNAINGALRLPNARPAAPQAGDTRYDPSTDTFEIYDGAVWRQH